MREEGKSHAEIKEHLEQKSSQQAKQIEQVEMLEQEEKVSSTAVEYLNQRLSDLKNVLVNKYKHGVPGKPKQKILVLDQPLHEVNMDPFLKELSGVIRNGYVIRHLSVDFGKEKEGYVIAHLGLDLEEPADLSVGKGRV